MLARKREKEERLSIIDVFIFLPPKLLPACTLALIKNARHDNKAGQMARTVSLQFVYLSFIYLSRTD